MEITPEIIEMVTRLKYPEHDTLLLDVMEAKGIDLSALAKS